MTKRQIARALLRDSLFLVLLIAPLTGGSVYLWSVKVKDRLADLAQAHSLAHDAVSGFLARDIDDLETQLQHSLEKNQFLPGDFRFHKEGLALRATHTSQPQRPLTIDLESEMAFAKPLNQVPNQDFVLVTENSEIISYSKNAKKEAFGTVSDAKLMNTEPSKSMTLSDFETARIRPLAVSNFLFERPSLAFTRSRLSKSNLVLFSYSALRPLWKESVVSLLLIALASTAAFLIGFGALVFMRTRQARSQAWLFDIFESLRFGRLDTEYPGQARFVTGTPLYAQVQESLDKNASLKRFLETDWIDASRSSVSWSYFKQTLAHWGEGLSAEAEDAPRRWYLGSCRVRRPELVEVFQRAFTAEFGERAARVYQSGETEFSFVLRDFSVANCLRKLKTILRSTSAGARLTTNDFAMSVLLVSAPIPGDSLAALAVTQERARLNLTKGVQVLASSCVELRHFQTGTELCTFAISEAQTSPGSRPAGLRLDLPEVLPDRIPKFFPKRKPVAKPAVVATPSAASLKPDDEISEAPTLAKKRPILPPPPLLKTKNLRAGRGYVRITDALGKSEWVEIASRSRRAPVAAASVIAKDLDEA